MAKLKYDEVGIWSEVKLDIIKKYAAAYSTILSKQQRLQHIYIDAFAGAGMHISKRTREFIPGSPLNALLISPPFLEYHLIDLDREKVQALRSMTSDRRDVWLYEEDCNEVLLRDVFPRARFESYRRALCLLDPYGLHLDWKVIEAAGRMRSIEIFLNFSIMDFNMNMAPNKRDKASPEQLARMDTFWGDGTWRQIAYESSPGLFGEMEQKASNDIVAEAFRKRLQDVAGFSYVPEPMPMRNSKGAVVYYLYFASPKAVAATIVNDIFAKYRNK